MNSLVVAVFTDALETEHLRLDLLQMQRERLIDLEEVVVAVRETSGKVVLHHATHLTLPGALSGGFLGTIDNPKLRSVAEQVQSMLKKVIAAL